MPSLTQRITRERVTRRIPRSMQPLAMLLAASTTLVACSADKLVVPNANSPTIDGAQSDPLTAIQLLATGVLTGRRAAMVSVRDWGLFGREIFNYTAQEGRNTTGYLITPDDPAGFGAGDWAIPYGNIRAIKALKDLVATSPIPAAQKEAALGFAQTSDAQEYQSIVLSRHDLGGPVDMLDDVKAVAPFVSMDSLYKFVSAKLNEAKTHLAAGGATFPFTLSAGYAGFTTPTTFIKFNRAMLARNEVYRGSLGCGTPCYQTALAALGESFVSTSAPLTQGLFVLYSTASGDVSNPFSTAANLNIGAHPSIDADAQLRADGSKDLRYTAKIKKFAKDLAPPANISAISTSWQPTVYPTTSSSIPIIRNEELILLRAEANYMVGNTADALTDLNFVRTTSGGLPALTAASIASKESFITALLYERRMSLFFEGHRWVDVRRFGRLTSLPKDMPDHVLATHQVVPQAECDVRKKTGNSAMYGPGCP